MKPHISRLVHHHLKNSVPCVPISCSSLLDLQTSPRSVVRPLPLQLAPWSICVITNRSFLSLKTKYYSTVYLYHTFFIHLSMDEHLRKIFEQFPATSPGYDVKPPDTWREEKADKQHICFSGKELKTEPNSAGVGTLSSRGVWFIAHRPAVGLQL